MLVPAYADQTQPTHRRKTARKAPPKPLPLPPMPAGPLPQVPMDMLPAVAPHVTYQNGALAISAQNSTLADVLREVRKRTGATIEMPPNTNERVVAQLGPGPVRDVLVSLLNGCSFNYVMLGTATDPNAVSAIVLTAKPAGGAGQQTVANTYQPSPYQPNQGWNPPQRAGIVQPVVQSPQAQPPAVQGGDDAEENQDEDKDDQDQADDNDNQDEAQPDQNQAPQGMQQPPNAGPKTPEQILQMLQRGQQQQPQDQRVPNIPPDQNPQQ